MDYFWGVSCSRGIGEFLGITRIGCFFSLGSQCGQVRLFIQKFLALWEGLFVVAASRWTSSYSFLFEFGFKFVVV